MKDTRRKYPYSFQDLNLLHPLNDTKFRLPADCFMNWQHSSGKITHVCVLVTEYEGSIHLKTLVYLREKKTCYKGWYDTYSLKDGSVVSKDPWYKQHFKSYILLDTLVTIEDFLKMIN